MSNKIGFIVVTVFHYPWDDVASTSVSSLYPDYVAARYHLVKAVEESKEHGALNTGGTFDADEWDILDENNCWKAVNIDKPGRWLTFEIYEVSIIKETT